MEVLQTMQFIKEAQITNYKELLELADSLQYEFHPKNTFLMYQGDEGDKFYMIVEGACDCYVPIAVKNCDPTTIFKQYNPVTGQCTSNDMTRKYSRQQIFTSIKNNLKKQIAHGLQGGIL